MWHQRTDWPVFAIIGRYGQLYVIQPELASLYRHGGKHNESQQYPVCFCIYGGSVGSEYK